MVDGGCCTSCYVDSDVSVGALLPEWALVFFDVAFLGSIMDVLLTFLPKTGPGPLVPIYCC